MEVQTYERMATVEAKLNQIESLLTKLDDKFDNMNVAFVPRNEIDEKFRHRDEKIATLQIELQAAKQERQGNKALAPAWVGVIISLIAILSPYFR